ncbi:radical SAM/SPASM domain-containing protein [Butyricimonas virosa]|uniref:radical SAM/SPASM domain-containing protein n=1 Tax=Butyricimonas virosa TaxID=544645 RepID=UPI0022E4BB52|nr:radical SAM protein [Butyricimonas virosa]
MKDMENYRLSSYTIFTKLEDTEDKYMLVHGYTGAIDITSENLVSFLKSKSKLIPLTECPFSKSTFDSLVKRGYITKRSHEDEIEYVDNLTKLFHKKDEMLYKSFLFVISYNCNFRCPYCYENEMSNQGNDWTHKTLTKEIVDRAYAAMLEIEPRKKLHANMITLYGGEPLLAENREIVEYLVKKGHDLGYKFSAITNGYDLDYFKDLLSPDLINRLQITVDGNREQHDKRRIHYLNKNSFDKIMYNIGIALDRGVKVTIRVNTDADNFESLFELQQLFDNLHYTENENFSFYSALLRNYEQYSDKNDGNTHFRYMDQKEFNRRHKMESYKIKCQDFSLFDNLSGAIKNKRLIDFGATSCSAQYGAYIFDPYGNIYPCLEVLRQKEHVLGNYSVDKIIWTDAINQWHNRKFMQANSCNSCKYALLCRGGCVKVALLNNGQLHAGRCDEFLNTFETAVNRVYKSMSVVND